MNDRCKQYKTHPAVSSIVSSQTGAKMIQILPVNKIMIKRCIPELPTISILERNLLHSCPQKSLFI